MGATSVSTVTLQQEADIASAMGDILPILNVSGSIEQPALVAANMTMNAICAVPFPHKWNEIEIPVFYNNSYQQDYAGIYPDGSSLLSLAWLERGIVIDISSMSQPKAYRDVEVGRQLPQATGSVWNPGLGNPLFLVNFFPNNSLYYGVWGQGNVNSPTFGNNPVAGSVYTSPLISNSLPANPIAQIRDANGNLLVLTQYGTEGTTAPTANAKAPAGTVVSGSGATTAWTVVDPVGQGFRILPVPGQTGIAWQFNLVGQAKPVRFTSLGDYLTPLPDEFEPHFFAGFLAQLYRFSPEQKVRDKFRTEWPLWLQSLNDMRSKQDREQEENQFVPERGIMGARMRAGWRGPGWPFNNPGS